MRAASEGIGPAALDAHVHSIDGDGRPGWWRVRKMSWRGPPLRTRERQAQRRVARIRNPADCNVRTSSGCSRDRADCVTHPPCSDALHEFGRKTHCRHGGRRARADLGVAGERDRGACPTSCTRVHPCSGHRGDAAIAGISLPPEITRCRPAQVFEARVEVQKKAGKTSESPQINDSKHMGSTPTHRKGTSTS